MADLKYYDVILKPVLTEKSMNDMAVKKYVFLVHPDATKNQIKEAVEKLFEGAHVERINTMNYQGKKKRRQMNRRYSVRGRTSARKKAVVQLSQNSREIELFQGM
ncbi:MAG: 50S ribosomal protein L23 [Clostridiales bacterium]|jgi:large subunit ribosomal protein L23|nr:50S ribosomal protein L23 [Clostridiales bacterium]